MQFYGSTDQGCVTVSVLVSGDTGLFIRSPKSVGCQWIVLADFQWLLFPITTTGNALHNISQHTYPVSRGSRTLQISNN